MSFRAVELALRKGFPAREVAEIMGALVLPIQEHEVVKALPEERVSERIVAQSVDVSVPQMRRETVMVVQPVLVERIKGRIFDQIAVFFEFD